MEHIINISVRKKIAVQTDDTLYICGNSDFTINFDFDDEWKEFDAKTARFILDNKTYIDVVFEDDSCPVPVISNTFNIKVGVFAGDLRTTTHANISAKKSILCGAGVPAAPTDDVYNQIMTLIQGLGDPDPEDIAEAVENYMKQHPFTETDPTVPDWAKNDTKPDYTAGEVGAVATKELPEAINAALAQAKESGEFNGKDGKDGRDGYTPQKGVDYFDGRDGQPGTPGKDGSAGKDGEDGYSPTVAVSTISGGHRVTITDVNGSKTFDVMDGKNGGGSGEGDSGANGVTFYPSVDAEGNLSWTNDGGLTNPETVNITGPAGKDGKDGAAGPAGEDGYTPVKGTDYWTDADKQEIVSAVLANFTDVSEVGL